MRFFRRKSEGEPDHQKYLDGLISSIRKARHEDPEQKPDLHAFVEEDFFPGGPPARPLRTPPGVAKPKEPSQETDDDAEAVADLEAYLSSLKAAEGEPADEDDESDSDDDPA